MKWLSLVAALAVFSSIAFAQEGVEKVIVVSDVTSADFLIAKGAGEKAGIPVLIAADGVLTDELKAQLAELKPTTIILIGGPAVIKEDVDAQLTALGYAVVRLWGVERTGTAVEAAKFFWREGMDCSVLVDDTKNSDADTEMQESASNLAANEKCALIPVPNGTLPAEVTATLQDLGAKEVRFIGNEIRAEVREKLKHLRLKEIVGKREKIEEEVENEIINKTPRDKRKLVIIAAPHWRHLLGAGGHPFRDTVVRIVSSVNQTPRLIELINARNITDVRVVGFPGLAQQIADQLNASGIAVKKVSGERASEVAHKVLKEFLERWREKRRENAAKEIIHKEKIRARLLLVLNNTEEHLDAWLVKLDQLAADGADADKISQLKELISLAQSRIGEIRSKILAGDFAGAERLLFELRNNFEKAKFRFRLEIKYRVHDEMEEEEGTVEKLEEKTDVRDIEDKLAVLRKRCANITAVESLVEKAKSLRDEMGQAKGERNYTKTAELTVEAHKVAEQARALRDVCEKRGEISDKLRKIAEERAERAEKLRERVMKRVVGKNLTPS